MLYPRSEFRSSAPAGNPSTLWLGDHRVDYLAFSRPEYSDGVPVVLLGGALQDFAGFRREVDTFLEQRPVWIVFLPGQGPNPQQCAELSFHDLAAVLRDFLDAQGVDRIAPVGLFFGALIAFAFASAYPGRTERSIFAGITVDLREGFARQLESALQYVAGGDMDKFARASVLHLSNPSKWEQTGLRERFLKFFAHKIQNMSAGDRQRYVENVQRLFRMGSEFGEDVRVPGPALVLSGEFDMFTTRGDNFRAAERCDDARFAVIRNADHLGRLQRSAEWLAACDVFLRGADVGEVRGVEVWPAFDHRLDPRWETKDVCVRITGPGGESVDGRLRNVNYDGCLVHLDRGAKSFVGMEQGGDHQVHIEPEDQDGVIIDGVPLPGAAEDHVRFVFMKNDFRSVEALKRFVDDAAKALVLFLALGVTSLFAFHPDEDQDRWTKLTIKEAFISRATSQANRDTFSAPEFGWHVNSAQGLLSRGDLYADMFYPRNSAEPVRLVLVERDVFADDKIAGVDLPGATGNVERYKLTANGDFVMLQRSEFQPDANSGSDGRREGAISLAGKKEHKDSVSFRDGDYTDYYRLPEKPAAVMILDRSIGGDFTFPGATTQPRTVPEGPAFGRTLVLECPGRKDAPYLRLRSSIGAGKSEYRLLIVEHDDAGERARGLIRALFQYIRTDRDGRSGYFRSTVTDIMLKYDAENLARECRSVLRNKREPEELRIFCGEALYERGDAGDRKFLDERYDGESEEYRRRLRRFHEQPAKQEEAARP